MPDIVLLDVMMPGMDGFEVCRRIKANPKTAHVPVVMVTALDQPTDRVAGLEAGADDFLTKPVDDAALFARVRSLVRLKMMTDELRMRETTGQSMGLVDPAETLLDANPAGPHPRHRRPAGIGRLVRSGACSRRTKSPSVDTFEEALVRVRGGDFDLIVVSLGMRGFDGLRLCSQLRSLPEGAQRADPGGGQRRRPPQADPGAGDGRQRLSDAAGRQERTGRARAHPAAQEALCRPAAPQCPAQPRNGDHRPAHRPAQSPLHERAISTI